jgi:hypothetical protein
MLSAGLCDGVSVAGDWRGILRKTGMIHLERSIDIDAAPDAVWGLMGRFMHIDEFAPLVKSVEALTDGEDTVGSKRRCHFEDGTSVVEEVTAWQDGRKYGVTLSEIDAMPLHELHAEMFVEPLSGHGAGGRSRVGQTMDFRVKYGPFGWLLGQTMMKMMMGKIMLGNLKGLEVVLASQK